MAFNMGLGGTVRLTSSALLLEGKPTRVYSIQFASAGTAGIVNLRDGSASGDIWLTETGTASTGKDFNYENGLYFANGCYAELTTTNVSYLTACVVREV